VSVVTFDIATFKARIGTTFLLLPGDGRDPVPLRLADVIEGRSGGGFQSFSVLFHGPSDRFVAQGLYSLEHDAFESLALFIVPIVGSNAERIIYEAVFTQRIESPAAP
jgi:hypothetical protein